MMRVEIFLVLTLLGFSYCFSTYQSTYAVAGKNYDTWRDLAWGVTNPSGGCAHLATYETQTQLNQIVSTITSNPSYIAANGFSFYVGAQKQPDSNLFVWAVGSRRGQPFFSASVISDNEARIRYLDINFESGFTCHQTWCFDREFLEGYVAVFDAEYEAVLFIYNPKRARPYQHYYVEPNLDALATFGVYEYEDAAKIANANGGSKFIVSYSVLPWIEANNEANIAGTYLARIETPEQQQWILDELQCATAKRAHYWIGYMEDAVTGKVVKGPGPAQRQVVWDPITGCTTDLYCEVSTSKKRAATDLTGIAPRSALYLDPTSAKWKFEASTNNNLYIYQAEYCSMNANSFFKNSFSENDKVDSRVCVPNPTNDWSSIRNIFDSNHGYFNEKSFFGGAGAFFHNLENGAKKLLYFTCECDTDPIINKACLGSDDFPACIVYTNNELYNEYGFYLYYYRLIQGLGYDYGKLLDYWYWDYFYQFL